MSLTREDLHAELDQFEARFDLDRFATKLDLDRFATKSDLERFATKLDLEDFATKSDLERFATKSDLEGFATKEFLRTELERFATKADVNALREEMALGFADLRRYMEILIDDVKSTGGASSRDSLGANGRCGCTFTSSCAGRPIQKTAHRRARDAGNGSRTSQQAA